MRTYDPDLKPWSFQIELVEGCNRRCSFCGIHAIRKPGDNHLLFMDLSLLESICKQINLWRPRARVELDLNGEPSLHPQFFEALAMIRRCAPGISIQVSTNMHKAFEDKPCEWLHLCFEAGANMVVANCYESRFFDQLTLAHRLGKLQHQVGPEVDVVDFYHDNPKHVSMYHNHGPKARILFLLDSLETVHLKTSIPASKLLNNQGGSTPTENLNELVGTPRPQLPLHKPCTRVYREMVIAWNGLVPICCYDWTNALVFGDARQTPIQKLWHSQLWHEVRGLLSRTYTDRNFSPCQGCDYPGGFRVGLLPQVEPSSNALQYVREHQHVHKTFRIGKVKT